MYIDSIRQIVQNTVHPLINLKTETHETDKITDHLDQTTDTGEYLHDCMGGSDALSIRHRVVCGHRSGGLMHTFLFRISRCGVLFTTHDGMIDSN